MFHVKSNYLLDTGLMQTTFNDITKITFVTNKIGVIVTGTWASDDFTWSSVNKCSKYLPIKIIVKHYSGT